MIDFHVFLLTLHPLDWVLIAVVLAAAVISYFRFIRNRTDPHVKELANWAYAFAAEFMGAPPRGSPPRVTLRTRTWRHNGVLVNGLYTWKGLWGYVLWDHIQVVNGRAYIFSVLVHEMTHALRRRHGKPRSERHARAAEAAAGRLNGEPEINILLEKL